MKALIFLDDERKFEDVTWVKYPKFDEVIVCRDSEEFFDVLDVYAEDDVWISFDHDIACYGERVEDVFGVPQVVEGEINGEHCCKIALQKGFNPHQMFVHSKNPVGVANIQRAIEAAKESWK